MTRQNRVVWFEGMTLDPHHFQQADRFHQASLNFRLRTRMRHDWGFADLQINKEDLANGQFSLLSAKGVMPDGLAFDMPGEDRLPKPRSLAELFPATAETLEVFLAIHAERPGGQNFQIEPAHNQLDTRYVLENIELADDAMKANVKSIGVAAANFQLKVAGEPLDEYSWLKVAEVKRTPKGFVAGETYIPPCLAIGASENLMTLTRELLGDFVSRAAEQRSQLPFGSPEYNANALTSLWLSNILNGFIPILSHHYHIGKCSPEELYLQLLSLAGQIMTYPTGFDIRPSDFPRYDHNHLANCFNTLAFQIREQLDKIVPSVNYESVKLEKSGENLWYGAGISEQLLQTAQFYLIASGDTDERKLIDEFPRKLKIAPRETIHALAMAAINGLKVAYAPRPPAGLPSGPGQHHFHLEKTGDFWDAICRSRSIGILVPAEFMKLKLELIALKPE